MKQKRMEEREAKKVAQATPNVVPVTSESSKKPEASSGEPANPKTTEPVKRKQKVDRQYMTVSFEETESNEDIKEVPKKKGVFSRVIREKKEEIKKESTKEPPWKTPKITIVHKHKPKSDEKSKPEAKRRTDKKKLDDRDIIDPIINDGNLDYISTFFDEFDEKDKKKIEESILLYLDSFWDKKLVDTEVQNGNTEQPASTPSDTTILASESNFVVEDTPTDNVQDTEDNIDKDKDTKNKVVEDAQDQDKAPSGEATGALEIKDSKDTSLVEKGKETAIDFSSSLAIDTSSIAKGNLSQFSINFDKPYHKMSLT
ncbi:nucleolin 1-like [Cryptomeria japonica]|uniref:nucleolin 1-like n=1 Tax=Cryptomeria japonica TaxID=3369 RepID=UPI0027DAA519|nr:nucleolin 1-like [Cryptomeria japonica]